MLRRMHELSIKVPVDDTHTGSSRCLWTSTASATPMTMSRWTTTASRKSRGKSAAGVAYPEAGYKMNSLRYQDIMAIETQGRVTARANWHPGNGGRGVRCSTPDSAQIDAVKQGDDPIGVVRDSKAIIDTNFEVLHVIGSATRGPQGKKVYEVHEQPLTPEPALIRRG